MDPEKKLSLQGSPKLGTSVQQQFSIGLAAAVTSYQTAAADNLH